MTTPYVTYVAAAGQRDFDVPFPFINRSHVQVRVNGAPVTPFSWPTSARLRLPFGVTGGAAVVIERLTPIEEQLVKFQDGNILTAEDLNIAVQQLLYRQQEVTGLYDRSLRTAQVRLGNDLGIVTDSAAVARELADLVLEEDVLSDFRQRFADIDLNANSILETSLEVVRINNEVIASASSISGLLVRVEGAEGAIVNEQTARVSATNALASDISTLSTTVNGNTASVSTLQSSINGLQARHGVSLDVNGFVTGFVQNNDGQSGSFTVLADRFAIVTPGSAPQVPFEVSGGIVRIKEANIGTLNVGKLSSGSLNAGITQNGDWTVGTGKIIWDNGTIMKVSGVGFGTANQFIEWFGPKMAINLCSEANAITYLKTNGSAYFGGTLSAGVLKNAAQTTQTAADASVSTGSFGSNGASRVVVVSYNSMRTVDITGSCPVPATPTVQIRLRRNGTILQTWDASGSVTCTAGFGEFEPGNWLEQIGASFTFTDNSGGTTSEYTAEIVTRSLTSLPSGQQGALTHTQSLSVISTEE